jgi:hypothetical protein
MGWPSYWQVHFTCYISSRRHGHRPPLTSVTLTTRTFQDGVIYIPPELSIIYWV